MVQCHVLPRDFVMLLGAKAAERVKLSAYLLVIDFMLIFPFFDNFDNEIPGYIR